MIHHLDLFMELIGLADGLGDESESVTTEITPGFPR